MDDQEKAMALYRALQALVASAGGRKLGFNPHLESRPGGAKVGTVDVGIMFTEAPPAESAAFVEAVKAAVDSATAQRLAPELGGAQQEARPDEVGAG